MIIFEKVSAKNFFSIGNQPITVYLNKAPTTLVTGSNGAGKSSAILDSIYFALFGRPFRNINKPNIVNSINGGDLEVELTFTVNNRKFRIVRGVKPNKFEIYDQNDRLIDQQSAVKDYQKHLEDNILGGLNEKVFKQVVIIGSADYKPFMQLKAADRREVIEELLDIKIFTQMLSIAKEKNSVLREAMRDFDYQIDITEEKIRLQKENRAKLQENNSKKIEQLEEQIIQETEKIDDKETKIKDIEKKKLDYSQKLVGYDLLSDSINDLQKLLQQLTAEKKSNAKQVKFFDDNTTCPTCKQDITEEHKSEIKGAAVKKIEDVEAAITQVKAKLSKKKDNLDIYEKIKDALNKYDNTIYKHETDIKSSNKFITRLNKEIDDLKNPKEQDNTLLSQFEAEHDKLKAARQEKITESNYYDVVSNMLKDGGIKTKIIRQYVPIMNQIINEYLIRFGLPIEFTLDENFNEIIRSRHRDSFQYNNFSEGEKQRIDTALLLAWRQIAKSKNTTNTNLLIMDETFDSSLDAAATEELLNMLLEMDKHTNIFIISHKADLSDKLRSHVEFEKHGNFTKIKERPD